MIQLCIRSKDLENQKMRGMLGSVLNAKKTILYIANTLPNLKTIKDQTDFDI